MTLLETGLVSVAVDKKALTEDDWADLEKVTSAYDKSKTLSEQAAWDFMKELPGEFMLTNQQ